MVSLRSASMLTGTAGTYRLGPLPEVPDLAQSFTSLGSKVMGRQVAYGASSGLTDYSACFFGGAFIARFGFTIRRLPSW